MALKIFVDFDGTITREDVGNAFFEKFGGDQCRKLVEAFREEKLSAQECFRQEVAAIGKINAAEADAFATSRAFDESFKTFVEFCRLRKMEFHILSDGLDYYIRRILEAQGVSEVPLFANTLAVSPPDAHGLSRLAIDFPYTDAECTRCACCKRNIMLTRAGEEDIIVYVGEGYSDRCPVQYADIVFAKDELQSFCQERNISYFLYNSFHEVVERLNTLLHRKRLRRRLQAERMRREAFIRE
jgi:2-hydroxy-3-keto-5-methylthiopentenyl-1-phosphate phosphatase